MIGWMILNTVIITTGVLFHYFLNRDFNGRINHHLARLKSSLVDYLAKQLEVFNRKLDDVEQKVADNAQDIESLKEKIK